MKKDKKEGKRKIESAYEYDLKTATGQSSQKKAYIFKKNVKKKRKLF